MHADWVVADLLEYRSETQAFELVIVSIPRVSGGRERRSFGLPPTQSPPGGVFVLVGHDSSNIEQGYGGPQDPALLYTAEDVAGDPGQRAADRAGRNGRADVETPDRQRIAIDALVRASRPYDA